MVISLDNQELVYSGRIDVTNPQKPEMIYPASSLHFKFRGRKAELTLSNQKVYWTNYVGAIIDGEEKKWEIAESGQTIVALVDEDVDKEHDVLFFKRQDSCHVIMLESLVLSEGGQLLAAPAKPVRRIEVYGDSVSAGEVSEALDYIAQSDPEHHGQYSNSYYSYAWLTARKLNAELHDVAQGGIPLVTGTGWVSPPHYPGMDSVWNKLHYIPQLNRLTDWDFSRYTPHVVIIAVAQNDSNPENYMKEDYTGEKAVIWRNKYRELVLNIREKYPKALILLTTTLLNHDANWDKAIEEVCQGLDDERVQHFLFKRNGCGTPGHLRIPEAEEMADELAAYLNGLDIPVWED
ncbi:electron transporter RnfD [Scatolibacter rhodanostii]|uniref:electron transporter RnfD n=1 Tax=Scatolibacter rhodanostii TaxID=2014781 RepID=UPI000C07C5C5|nr:electron transporter RnfD [Scatolibacter rhodanostii]